MIVDDDDGEAKKSLSISFSTSCDGNTVTVKYKGDPKSGVDVVVIDDATLFEVFSGSTDTNGQVEFTGCDLKVRIHASRSGYTSESTTKNLVDCATCPVECVEDNGCLDDEYCMNGQCVPVLCPCGEIDDHRCIEYECCADTDCPEGQACVDNECQYRCTSDADCTGTIPGGRGKAAGGPRVARARARPASR